MLRVWGERPGEAELEWFYERNPVRPALVLLAEEDGKVVGSVAISSGASGSVGFAVDLATDPAYRGRGIFSELMAASEERVRDLGVRLLLTVPTPASARVLLGRLGDPVDRGALAGLGGGERRAGGTTPGGLGIEGVAVGAGLGMAEELIELGLDPWGDRGLEALGLDIGLRPAEPDDLGQQPLAQCVAPEDSVRGGAAGLRELQLAALGEVDEPVGGEPLEHLARGLRGHPELPRDLGRRDP
jgi:GNAT superfamily N-acetyltransferase